MTTTTTPRAPSSSTPPIPSIRTIQRTEVLTGEQNVVDTVLQFVSNAKNRIDACIDSSRPSLAFEIEVLKKAFLDAMNRGVKLRYVTEINEDNVKYCKELINMVDDLRHLEGIKGNFYVNETEYIAPATLHENGKPASQITYSSVKEIVEHHTQYVFDTLWSRAIPAEQRIQEIEKTADGIPERDEQVIDGRTAEESAVYTQTKIILEYQYQIFKKLENSIEKNQANNKKIRSMLQPIIQKQLRDAKRQSESIKQLQYQLKQLQKQLSDIQKSMRRLK
ncbi:MAG TPA: hypothetical protein VE643_09910 [Nitrososphaeraceae archaeon]|nr:hypothetical protein [Nitrososphaeraceae archaeon]